MTIEELTKLLESDELNLPGDKDDIDDLAEMIFKYIQHGWILGDPKNLKVLSNDLEVWKEGLVQGFIYDWVRCGDDEYQGWHFSDPYINLPNYLK